MSIRTKSIKTSSIFIVVLLLMTITVPVMTAPTASATACNILPPWGVGIGLCDFIGCCDVVSILNVFNCFNLINILGIVGNCFSGVNYSVECGWNFLSYCIWPCTLFNCCNVLDMFSGRVTCFNLIQVMSGICNFANVIDILSGACINLMSVVKLGSGLFPPCIASGGCLNIGTGCNPCNPLIPFCVNTGLTDCLNILFLPLTIIMSVVSSIALPFISLWGTALSPVLTGMSYNEIGGAVIGCVENPMSIIPAVTGTIKSFLYSIGLIDILGDLGSICSGCLGWILSKIMGLCQSAGVLNWITNFIFGSMAKYLPMNIGFA
jgi:hypothetical protein